MTKSKFLFTAILATMISVGAWANAPTTDTEREEGTVHDVYNPTGLAESGIAGVTYVNRVGEMAGAAAAAAEAHAADASKSAYAAQSSADAAAGAASAALNEKVSLPADTNDSPIKNVGTNARPVYVNNGTAAAVQSITIPVGSENFATTITSTNVAKIWIQ
ncbi:MAG: hypothetical protein IKL37_01050 [Alphaproteobacteria bacterium]|nr:hypothetical protein [Alphaproteobacteria bacterium]